MMVCAPPDSQVEQTTGGVFSASVSSSSAVRFDQTGLELPRTPTLGGHRRRLVRIRARSGSPVEGNPQIGRGSDADAR